MLIVTTDAIPGKEIVEVKGLCKGSTVRSKNVGSDIGASLKGCVIYVTSMPCPDCARAIIQSGIKMVVTYKPEFDENAPQNTWRDKLVFSEEMFKEAGIEYLLLPPKK